MVRVFGQKLGIFITKIENFSKTKLQNTIKLVIIRFNIKLQKKSNFAIKKLNYKESIKITASYLKFTATL